MLKFELRKLTTAIMFLAVVGMLAACSGSSSTDDTLTYPGANAMGTIRFDVDPAAATVTATPTGSPFTNNALYGNGGGVIPGITITSSGAVWAGGTNTIDFDVTIKNTDTTRELSNVRIGVNSSTNLNAKTVNGDRCTNAAWSTCLPTIDPAIVWVADNTLEGPVTKRICNNAKTSCVDSYYSVIFQGCGQIKSHWTINAGGSAQFSFWSTLFADATQTTDLLSDSRYDPYTASVYTRTYKLSTSTSSFPGLGVASNSMVKGEWFYVTYGIDWPGNGAAYSFPYSDYVNNLKHIEDTGNMAAVATGSYYYLGNLNPFTIRFDPAIIEINANDGSTPGNNVLKFNTAATVPYTRMKVIQDPNGSTDGYLTEAMPLGYTSSNAMGCFIGLTGNGAWSASLYPNAGNGLDGFANLEWNVGFVALRVKLAAVSGTGSAIHSSWDSGTYFVGYDTGGTPYPAGDDTPNDIKYSTNWPQWCERLPGNGCTSVTSPPGGLYNMERSYVCVQ